MKNLYLLLFDEIKECFNNCIFVFFALVITVIIFVFKFFNPALPLSLPSSKVEVTDTPPAVITNELAEPVAQFKERITKKPFGIYITPQKSPIFHERFTGFHSGVDVEYQDVLNDVPIFSIADGMVVISEYASGYGGVMVIKYEIKGKTLYGIYGHLKSSSMLKTGVQVKKGEQIGILGTGYSSETDR